MSNLIDECAELIFLNINVIRRDYSIGSYGWFLVSNRAVLKKRTAKHDLHWINTRLRFLEKALSFAIEKKDELLKHDHSCLNNFKQNPDFENQINQLIVEQKLYKGFLLESIIEKVRQKVDPDFILKEKKKKKLAKVSIIPNPKRTTFTKIETFCEDHLGVMSTRLRNVLLNNLYFFGGCIENIKLNQISEVRNAGKKTEEEFFKLRGY